MEPPPQGPGRAGSPTRVRGPPAAEGVPWARGCGSVARGAEGPRVCSARAPLAGVGHGLAAAWTARERVGPRRKGTTRAPACPGDPARVTFAVWWTRETGAGQSSPSLPLLKEKGTSANLANTCGAPSPVSPHPGQCGLREWLWILFSCFSQVLEIPSPGRWG